MEGSRVNKTQPSGEIDLGSKTSKWEDKNQSFSQVICNGCFFIYWIFHKWGISWHDSSFFQKLVLQIFSHKVMISKCCLVAQLCPILCDPMDCSPPGSSVHGIFQARIPEWVAISSSRGSSQLRDRTHVSCIGRCILYHWDTKEAHDSLWMSLIAYKGSVPLSGEHLPRTGLDKCTEDAFIVWIRTCFCLHIYGLIFISQNTSTKHHITVALDGLWKVWRAGLESENISFKTQFHYLLAGWPGSITQHLDISFSSYREWKYYCIHLPEWWK